MFEIGDLVICVNDKRLDNDFFLLSPPLKKGRKYIVFDIKDDTIDVGLKMSTGGIWWVFTKRFVNIREITKKDNILQRLITQKELELN